MYSMSGLPRRPSSSGASAFPSGSRPDGRQRRNARRQRLDRERVTNDGGVELKERIGVALSDIDMDEHIGCDAIDDSGFVRFTRYGDDANLDIWIDRTDEVIEAIRTVSGRYSDRKKVVVAAELWNALRQLAEK